jgi:hypothetical protein
VRSRHNEAFQRNTATEVNKRTRTKQNEKAHQSVSLEEVTWEDGGNPCHVYIMYLWIEKELITKKNRQLAQYLY